jgi:type I restriction enzyme S subunit
MLSEWREVTLGDLGEVNRGRSRHRPRYADHLYGGPYPFIQTGDIRESGGRITKHNQTYSEEGLKQSRLWPAETMCITIAANIAETAILTYPACFPDSVVGFIADQDKCDVKFIEYTFRNLKRRLQAEATGSVQDNINLGTLSRLYFKVPQLSEQKAIAHILGSLDDKIELSRKMNETLEAMAQALFKSWFVDFDPVIDNALAAGNEIPEELQKRAEIRAALDDKRTSLPSEIRKLFPSEFTETDELGWIPKGWTAGRIKDIANNPTRSIKPDEMEPATPYIGLQDMPQKSIALSSWGYSDNVESSKYSFIKGEILFGKLRPYFHKVGIAPVNGVCSTDILVIVPKIDIWFSLVLGHITNVGFIDFVTSASTGTRMPRTNWKDMGRYQIAIPPKTLAEVLTRQLKDSIDKIILNIEQARELAKLRDTLLPKLLSGEIRITEADKMVED